MDKHIPVYLRATCCALLLLLTVPSLSAQSLELHPMSAMTGVPNPDDIGKIVAVCTHPDGGFLLLEAENQRVLQFDRNGQFVNEAGGFGFGAGSLRGATDITCAGFEVWVCDQLAGRIVRYDARLAPLEPWTEALEQGTQAAFTRPMSIARAASGDVVLIEHERNEAWLLDPDGRLLDRIGQFGEMDREFSNPTRVEIARDGTIAIADPGQQAVFLFDRFGTPRGYRPWVDVRRGPFTVAWVDDHLFVADSDRLRLLNPRGQIVQEWESDLFGGAIRDIACDGNQLLIATGTTVARFRITQMADDE